MSCNGQQQQQDATFVINWLVNVSFWVDIILNFRTAIVDPKTDDSGSIKLVADWKVISLNYLKFWFWLDVLGSLPVTLIENAISGDQCGLTMIRTLRLNRLARLARLVKLLRLARLTHWNKMIARLRDAFAINPGHLRLVKLLLFVIVLSHCMACFLFLIVDFEQDFAINWASEFQIYVPGDKMYVLSCPPPLTDAQGNILPDSKTRVQYSEANQTGSMITECLQHDGVWLEEASSSVQYLASMYFTLTTLTTVGYGDITMRTTPELVYCILMMAIGASTFAVIVGSIESVLGKMDFRGQSFREQMEILDDFMHQENLPLDLRIRTRSFFEYDFNHSRDIPKSVEELSSTLRTEVALLLYNDLITSVPFFRNCGQEFLTEIIFFLKARTLCPGDILYEGSYFGENCVLGLDDHRNMTIRATTWCNLFALDQVLHTVALDGRGFDKMRRSSSGKQRARGFVLSQPVNVSAGWFTSGRRRKR
eukprot:753536-Hanusia_phi.AAC.8